MSLSEQIESDDPVADQMTQELSLSPGLQTPPRFQEHGDRWQNSVLQLKVTRGLFRVDRPYKSPIDKQISGTGFIINIEDGIIATNAHVVRNSITIMGRLPQLGKHDISLELLSICKEKDLALCRIDPADIEKIKDSVDNPNTLDMMFGDNMLLKKADKVMTIGYPLGDENIKLTTGDVAGFHATVEDDDDIENGDFEDSYSRDPSYIQVTAPINPGNSGGPLLNERGEVIGINAAGQLFAQNVGYAIGSRTFMSIYQEMLKSTIVKIPTMSFDFNKTNDAMMKVRCGQDLASGIYVRKVHPDSCFIDESSTSHDEPDSSSLQHGDIITHFEYDDPFWNCDGSFSISHDAISCCHSPSGKETCSSNVGKTVTCFIDRYGDISVYRLTDSGENQGLPFQPPSTAAKLSDRKMGLSEIADMIPIGSKIRLQICRGNRWYILSATYKHVETERISRSYPQIIPIDYEVFAGICVANLSLELTRAFDFQCIMKSDKCKYREWVVICQVFPNTAAGRTQTLRAGDIISKLNGKDIMNLNDIREIIHTKPDALTIETKEKAMFVVDTSEVANEDTDVMKRFMIPSEHVWLGNTDNN